MVTYTKRKHLHLGVFRLNFAKHSPIPFASWRLTSWSIHLLGWTWNSRTHATTVDVPGVGGHYNL